MFRPVLNQLKRVSLTAWIFIGIILGILSGITLGETIIPVATIIGGLFLRLLKMIIIPLIFTSITSGVLGIGTSKNLGRLGLKTMAYYVASSLIAILTGLLLVNIIKPGVGAELGLTADVSTSDITAGGLGDILYRIVPDNPISSMANGEILPIIFFCIILGVFISKLNDRHRMLMTDFFNAGFEVMMSITHFIIWFAPLGVFGLIAKITATTGLEVFRSLGMYFITVLAGLLIHYLVSLPLFVIILSRENPIRHLKNMGIALLTAFTTSSSSATLPLTLECAEENAGISNKISSFVLPLGATVNMDGTALYECVAAMFIAQVYGIELNFAAQFTVVITALLASIGAAGIPMAGLVMMTIILKAVGLPLEGIGLILAVDRILDMIRTSTNVWSDSCGTLIIAKSEGELK
ncbi:MAG: dicarboxylate/amino acid:cation symporter [Bacteroidetes bacterium]|nr:dicarboxylate/amino acid:cation symporter [Bacteroidota bacterium]MBL7066949.1 dicarboxylate/amino acid:cation symporter [Candidatus Neomarinimicrobiota bacterium]